MILDKITFEKFVEFWEIGEQENFTHTQSQNKTFVLKYFENIKEAYETAVNEKMALIFRIG
jgi:hypothetical protein